MEAVLKLLNILRDYKMIARFYLKNLQGTTQGEYQTDSISDGMIFCREQWRTFYRDCASKLFSKEHVLKTWIEAENKIFNVTCNNEGHCKIIQRN